MTLLRKCFKTFLPVLSALFLLQHYACKNGGVEPPDSPKNPRNYTWTADTISYPGSFQTKMEDIWGSSPSNVYVVGHNASPGPGTMYKFNGNSWTTTGFHAAEGGSISGALELRSVYGFSANAIWVVGQRIYQNANPPPNFIDSSLIIHFNGQTWTEHMVSGGRTLQAVWGSAPKDVWTGGINGSLYHFNGIIWVKISMPEKFGFNSIHGSTSTNVYAVANELDSLGATTSYFLHCDGVSWTVVDSFKQQGGFPDKFGIGEVRVFGSDIYTAGYGIFKRRSTSWQTVFNDASTGFADLNGNSSADFFVAGLFGSVYHHNGIDWHRYDQFLNDNVTYQAVWANDSEAFIVGFVGGGERSIVQRGK